MGVRLQQDVWGRRQLEEAERDAATAGEYLVAAEVDFVLAEVACRLWLVWASLADVYDWLWQLLALFVDCDEQIVLILEVTADYFGHSCDLFLHTTPRLDFVHAFRLYLIDLLPV